MRLLPALVLACLLPIVGISLYFSSTPEGSELVLKIQSTGLVKKSSLTTPKVKTLSPKVSETKPQPEIIFSQIVTVRAYCPCLICCGKHADGKVAWRGYRVQDDFIAISRDLEKDFPMGSKIHIKGLGVFWVADRTHPKKSSQIEILFTRGNSFYHGEHSAAWHFPTDEAMLSKQGDSATVTQFPGIDRPLRWEKHPWSK